MFILKFTDHVLENASEKTRKIDSRAVDMMKHWKLELPMKRSLYIGEKFRGFLSQGGEREREKHS